MMFLEANKAHLIFVSCNHARKSTRKNIFEESLEKVFNLEKKLGLQAKFMSRIGFV